MECVSTIFLSILSNVELHLVLILLHLKLTIVDVQYYAENTECPLQSSVKSMQSNGWSFARCTGNIIPAQKV